MPGLLSTIRIPGLQLTPRKSVGDQKMKVYRSVAVAAAVWACSLGLGAARE